MITLPGSNYHDPIPWFFCELFDWLHGARVAGGRSVRFDKHRRTVYPRANGEDDWSYKTAFGATGQGQLGWAMRHLKQDSTSRRCVISPWQWERDLVRFTARMEEGLNRGEEYQRLPCIVGIQYSADDTLEEGKKGLNTMMMQRALDFTGAVHTDFFRVAESAHWLATHSYTGGYAGHFTCLANTCVIESYGAQRFNEFKKLMEWWNSDELSRSILKYYIKTNQSLDSPQTEGAPSRKAYEWYDTQWKNTELCINNAIKNQWRLFSERLAQVEYRYNRDFANLMALFEFLLLEELAPEIIKYHWDAEQCAEARNLEQTLGEYPPFYFLKQIQNWMQYYAGAELTRIFVKRRDWHKLEELFNLTENTKKLQNYMLMDASRLLSKKEMRQMKGMKPFQSFYVIWEQIFDADKVTKGGLV